MKKTLYIINPTGHGGTGIKAWEAFQKLWSDTIDPADVVFTKHPGHAREIATSAEGYDTITAVGGDGTVGDINSGIMDREGDQITIAIIPAGTGNDIARNIGISSLQDAVSALKGEHIRAFDLIQVDYQESGKPGRRYAFLSANVGFSAMPMVKPWMKRILGPKGAYYLGTFLQILFHRSPHLTVRVDENECWNTLSWMIIIANVESSSGGCMRIGPGARTDDGELNITIFPAKSKFTMVTKLLPKVPSGEQINAPGVLYFPGKQIEVVSDSPAILDLDGDVFGTIPATFTVCPGLFRVMVPNSKGMENT